ncbi:Ig-like domain-containing protein [Secundilactobacillus silagei]|uniref:Extracellular protein n=1 Tax=Secundilactobacillus silagei JCM 19001 TaxID=1302250 RepID=A0A1Z5IIQ6_9LACO|nr:Ig-like domain-containing protein [Secundilactobacillus silagei]TDG73077.1 hypothetical protein C5L25_000718 [Secundilactobacillus silagei JCM 19001]GAX01518.1 extracellular protein [Secundilactobacillus silagei JCM 19001]
MKKLVILSSSLIAAFGLLGFGAATTTQASAKTAKPAKTTKTTIVAGSPSLSINKIYSNSTSVTGTASKGTKITVENSKQKQIASSMASKKTGKYTVKLPAKQKAATKLYVYAKYTTNRHYLYRIMTVQAAGSAKTATKKVTTKKAPAKKTTSKKTVSKKTTSKKTATKTPKLQTPTGTWQSTSYKGASMKFTFSQKTGLNQYVTQGKKTTHVLKNATYSVDPQSVNFWKINVTAKGGAKTTFYMRFKGTKQFVLVNSKNQAVKTSVGKAPAGNYTFNLQ